MPASLSSIWPWHIRGRRKRPKHFWICTADIFFIWMAPVHFLCDLGKDLFGAENDTIRKRLSKHSIQERLRKRARDFKKPLYSTPHLVDGFVTAIEQERSSQNCPLEAMPEAATYTLIMWALEGKNQGKGCGFPFDQPYLVFYQRLQKLGSILRQLTEIRLQRNWKGNRIYGKVLRDLADVLNDPVLGKAASKMEKRSVYSTS